MITDRTIERIRKFTADRDWEQFHTPVNLAKSICIEASELLECFQWSDTDFDREHACEELADVMNYCLQMCDALNADPDQIINAKCTRNELKYPVEKAKGKADKYTEL
ncbi:MAG: nucleotide pyrophosphohydrolase [Erysipelotrichaceae bacterium]|jgi:NTP pyrophosphatase (non-canonical NTP hydrolase)|nr:nucleotide pyrophosphohydrolase [Erysipelotrichaceae bacterium]